MVEGEASLNVPYVPVSGNADPKLVVPSNIADAQRRAVQQLEREVGQTVDAYTAQEMGWTIPELYSRLSAAQIEAVGLFIRNANTRQTGLINSDQTGVGKGRVVATIIEWARKHNKVPIFITASKQLYSDMAGRDLPSIGNTSFRPFITDSDYIYLNGEGEEVSQKPGSRTQRETMLRAGQTGSLPPGSDGIFTTYYQLRGDKPTGWREEPRARARRKRLLRPRPDGPRLAMMRALAPNAIFILDEAHEAAGADSDTGLSLQSILRDAAGAMYASATFAKRPANLMLYALGTSLKLSRLNQQQLERLFTTGGIPLQQALTTMLAEEGEFVRREQNMKGVDFHFESATQNTAQEVEQADVYTSFLRDLFPLADQVNQAMAGIVDGINQDKPEEAQIDLANTNFGAKLFQLSNQYLFSLRADATARKAIEVLKAGQKPFIAVYNTMQGPIGDLQNRRLPLTFGGLLLRQMQKMLEVKVRDPLAPANPQLGLKRGQRLIVLTPEDLPDGGELYHRIEAQIRNTDFGGMPISPIDTIKTAIQRAGFSIGELTAREGEIDETGQEIVLRKREKIERNKILRAYNGDESQGPITHPLDALIVNGSASTGLSAHTDPKFKDQRQRHMIVAQPAPDINIFMQMLGRIMRFGQTKLPVYTILTTSLSAERRFMTMLRGKLSSLNANTSADTESGVTGELAPDIFNFIGDSIVAEVMQANPELAELALIDLPNFRVPESLDDYARKATGMFVLLPDADAARLWRDISEIYDARIQALDEAGENPLKANIDDLRARTLASAELEHGTGETVFAGPVILEKLSVSPTSKPYTYAEAKALATEQEATNDQRVDSWIQRHSQAVDARLEAMRAREMSDEQITRTNNALWATRDSVLDAQRMLGSVVEYTISGHRVALAVPISIELKDSSPGDFSAASRHRLVLATNGLRKRVTVPLSQLDNLERVAESPAEQFESERQLAGERYAVTGNLLKGLAAAYGMSAQGRPRVTIYSTSTGELKTGVLMPPGWTPERATRRVPVENREDFATAVNNREAVNSANGEIRIADRQLSVWSRSDFRHIWGDRRFNNFFEASPVEHAGVFRGTIQRSQVASLYDFLIEKGLSLVFPGQSTPIQFTEEDTQQSRSASRAGMPLADVQAHLEAQGHTETGLVRVIDDPNSDADAQVVFDQTTGELLRIELNAAKLSSTEQVDSRLRHEFSHIVWRDGGVAEVLEALTEKERQDISETVARLGYSPANVMEETGARQVEALVDAFRKRSWFGRLVARVHVWAHNHGFKLTRRAAELIAAEAVAKVNAENVIVQRNGEPVSLQESVQQSRVEPGDEGVPPDEAETGTAGRVFERAISEEFRRPTQFAGATGPLSPEARAEGGQFTARELENLGLPTVEFETENHSRMFTGDAWQPNEAAGQRLLERHVWLMDHAAELYPDDGTRAGVLGTWINSLRNILGTMAERRENGEPVTFSEALQNDLRGLVQGQARFWGQLLASLRGMSSSILWAVRNADAILRTMRNEAFGGQAVSQFLDIIREHFRETWTTEAVTRLVKETRLASRLQDIAQISEDDLVALVRQTLQTPGIRHVNEFGTIFSRLLGEQLGVDPKNAAQKFNDAAGVRLKNALSRAKEGAWARMEKNLRRAINRRTPLWRRLDAILQDGDLDFEEAITRMARNEGWTVPTPEEIARLQALAEREIELRTLPKETLDKIAALPRAEQKSARAAEQRDLEAATDTERAELIKRMNVTWSRWTRPVSWRAYLPRALGGHPSLEVVQNNAQAINEWITANLLLKLGFFVRQSIDVGVQTLTHDPTRALATAMLTHKDEIARGVFTADFWADAGAALKTAFDLRARTLRHAFAGAKQGLRGKGVIKHSERISHRLDIFERMMQQADRLAEEGKTGQAFAVRLVTWVRSALLFSRALDMLSTTGAEYVEVAHRIRTAMKEQGKSRAEIDQQIDLVFGEMKTQYVEAYARAQQIFAALGIKEDKTALDEAAGNIVRARAYTALRAIDSKSDNFQAVAEDVANTLGWNEREAAGVGGAVGGLLRKAQRGGESIGIPTAFVSAFGNAIAIGINRKLTWMGLGKLAQGGGENPWYRTELDREQRLAEGFIGAGVSAFMASLVMLGAIAVRGFWPKDDKEREKWRIEGRRPGTLEIPVGDGQFIPLSLSVGPFALIAPALVSAGQLRQLFDDRAEKQTALDKDAAKRGVKAGKIDPVNAGDVIRVAGNALGASLVNARTVSGIVGAATDQGAIEPVKILASAISGVTPPLPAWQDLMRIAGVYMNPRLATLGDMLVPMPGSPARRVNVLGDPSGNFDQVQQIVQTLTGGTYPAPVNPKLAQKQPAYEALFHANWVPSPPIPSRGYVINGVYRPMSRSELQDYTEKRGTLFARELAPIARQVASASQQAAQKLVQDAFSRANDNALRQVGVNIEASVAPRAFAAAAPARTFETGGSRAAVPALATLAFGGMGGTLPDFAPATSRGGLRRGLRRGLRIRRPRALRGRRVRLTRTRLPRVRLTSRRRTSRRGLRTLRL